MLDYLAPEVFFEVDTYWAKTAGIDPAGVGGRLGARAPLLHIGEDGPCVMDDLPMTAVGDGVQDVSGIVAVGVGANEWLIVELDRCATDMLEAVTKSYRYMIGRAWRMVSATRVGVIGCGNISGIDPTNCRVLSGLEVAAPTWIACARAKAAEHGIRAAAANGLPADPASTW